MKQGGRLLSPGRYRHPGDVIRLIVAGLVLSGALAVTVVTHGTYAGASAAAVTAVAPATLAGRVLAGLVQALFAGAAVAAIVVTLRYHRCRLLAGLAAGAVLAGAVLTGMVYLAGGERPRALAAGAASWPWLTGASLVGPALGAAAVAGTVAAASWLTRLWRRTAWILLWLAAVVRLITGTAWPVEVVLAFAAGVTVGAAALVLFGVPDRRIGPAEIATALGSAGLPVARVSPAAVKAKGSRPFTAATESIVLVGAVYLGASALAAAAPTPGGLGAIEAALISGLNGVGTAAGPAVSAVLLDTGTLRSLDARVQLAGQNPRLVAHNWLLAQGLIPAGGEVH